MPRLGRLKKRPEFLRVAGKGRKAATPGLVLQALERPAGRPPSAATGQEIEAAAPEALPAAAASIGEPRVGFTASRKVGKAVERNRARRRLRAAVAAVLEQAGRPGWDYVVVARQGTLSRPWPALLSDLRAAVARVETAGRPDGGGRAGSKGGAGRRPPGKGGPRRGAAQAKEAG